MGFTAPHGRLPSDFESPVAKSERQRSKAFGKGGGETWVRGEQKGNGGGGGGFADTILRRLIYNKALLYPLITVTIRYIRSLETKPLSSIFGSHQLRSAGHSWLWYLLHTINGT